MSEYTFQYILTLVPRSFQFHPDSSSGQSSEFRRVMDAYKVLIKPESRTNYDLDLLAQGGSSSSNSSYVTNNMSQFVRNNMKK